MDFHDPTLWVAVAFVLFVGLTFKPIKNALTGALDARADKIRQELEEAARLREEAQKLLADYKRKQSEVSKEAEELLEHAKVEAARLREAAEKDVEDALKRRQQAAVERIEQAEAKALEEVRGQAVEIAIAATGKLLAENIDDSKAAALVQQSISELKQKIH
jgi:F-type H+-transporting ATPase subunit b